jgi:hypothetical protein
MHDVRDGVDADRLGLAQRIEQAGANLANAGSGGIVTVQHRWLCDDGETLSHTQSFDAHGDLRRWRVGEDTAATLTIVGSKPSADDRARAKLHRDDAIYLFADGVPRDVLALPVEPWRYGSFELPGLECLAVLDAGDGPEGMLRRTIEFSQQMLRGGINRAVAAGADAALVAKERTRGAFRVNAPYAALLCWLHTEMVLGHLMQDGYDLAGDLWRLSAMDGMLDATRGCYACSAPDLLSLQQYGFARRRKRTVEIVRACLMGEARAAMVASP